MKIATNLQIKFLKSLHLKKNRQKYLQFICEGPKIVGELIRMAPQLCHSIYATKDWIEINQDLDFEMITTTPQQMRQISHLESPSSVLALVNIPSINRAIYFENSGFGIYLDQIRDPGNLGTMIRTAHWYGVSSVFASPNCVDVYNPKTIQATMGSIFDIDYRVIALQDLVREIQFDVIYGAFLEGLSIYTHSPKANSLLVLGNESHGISDICAQYITTPITIPQFGKAESLNVSVASGILMDYMRRHIQ